MVLDTYNIEKFKIIKTDNVQSISKQNFIFFLLASESILSGVAGILSFELWFVVGGCLLSQSTKLELIVFLSLNKLTVQSFFTKTGSHSFIKNWKIMFLTKNFKILKQISKTLKETKIIPKEINCQNNRIFFNLFKFLSRINII